jgi:hypothetical protein
LHRQSPYPCGRTDREQANHHPSFESHEPQPFTARDVS